MGLYRLNPSLEKLENYSTENGLPSNVITGLIRDKLGILWISTSGGICRFDYKNKTYTTYNKDDGMQSNEFRPRSIGSDQDGNLYFGGINGFNIIDPAKIERNLIIPKIKLTGMDIFHIPIEPNTPGSPLNKIISETNEIKLKYNQSVLTFHFGVLDYTSPNKNQHAYILENFDSDWTFCGSDREATYTNLDPGEYRLRIKGANNEGIWNDEGISLKIIVTPPWWQTWWFKSLILLSVVLIVAAIFYYRISSLKKQKIILEQRVERRTRELASINTTKDKLFSIIAHDLRNPFNVILSYSDMLYQFNHIMPH